MDLKDKKIGVLGFGEENIALVKYLANIGISNMTICDDKQVGDLSLGLEKIKDITFKQNFGSHYLDNLNQFDIVFRTPGLAYLTPEIQAAISDGVEVSSQTKLFFELCPCPIIGVTGTKGKGTTATLIAQILKKAKLQDQESIVYLAGNIGNAPIEFIGKLKSNDIVVLELSSFQLQDLTVSPHIAVVLNIASDHLDKHATRDEYVKAKTSIVCYQKENDYSVINADYLTSIEFASMTKGQVFWFSRQKSIDSGVWVKNRSEITLQTELGQEKVIDVKDILLRGEHNLENISAAALASYLMGASIEIIAETIKEFKGLEHRLEFVGQTSGIKYYNDSFSTNPDTAIAAIRSFSEPIVLVAGGSEKNADYKELGEVISHSTVKTVILIGETGPRIKTVIRNSNIELISDCQNLDEVMGVVQRKSLSGDVVLLSPASASFDWFVNYKERGKKFKEIVMSFK